MSGELVQKRHVHRIEAGPAAVTISTGVTASGEPMAELAPTGVVQLSAKPLRALIGQLERALKDLEGRKDAPPSSPQVLGHTRQRPPGFLDSVQSGGRDISMRKMRTRDGHTSILLEIHDARRGLLGEITLLASGARQFARVLSHHVSWVFSDAPASASPPTSADGPAPTTSAPVHVHRHDDGEPRRPGSPPASWVSAERAGRGGNQR